jgi:hypothetical protein
MAIGYFLVRGDKTTCGGVRIEYNRHELYSLLGALECHSH